MVTVEAEVAMALELEATAIEVLLDRLLLVVQVELNNTELLIDAEEFLCLTLITEIWAAVVAVSQACFSLYIFAVRLALLEIAQKTIISNADFRQGGESSFSLWYDYVADLDSQPVGAQQYFCL